MLKNMLRKLATTTVAAGLIAGTASGAMAFCFSNDSLSNTEMLVTQVDQSKFVKVVTETWKKSGGKICKIGTVDKTACKLLGASAKVGEALVFEATIGNVNRAYNLLTGRSVLGDKTNHVKKGWDATVKKGWNKTGDVAMTYIGDRLSDAGALLSTKFRKRVGPDGTRCCSWKDKSCNKTGKKNAKLYFEVEYAGTSRVVQIGATDHMECRIDKKNKAQAGCVNYVFPESPFRAHKKTNRNMLIKSKHTGKCLEIGGWKKNNGANVNMWKCHGGKNQRWTVYKNGTIRSDLNGKCLDVKGALKGGKNGQNVFMWDCHGGRNQRWTYGRDGKILSRAAGKFNWCLEVGGWNKKDGANANIWKCGGKQANQSWAAVKK